MLSHSHGFWYYSTQWLWRSFSDILESRKGKSRGFSFLTWTSKLPQKGQTGWVFSLKKAGKTITVRVWSHYLEVHITTVFLPCLHTTEVNPQMPSIEQGLTAPQALLLTTWGNCPSHPTSITWQVTATLTSKCPSHGSFLLTINTAGVYCCSILFLNTA